MIITAKRIAKLMDCGYLAMNPDNSWTWWYTKPELTEDGHWCITDSLSSFGKSPRYPTRLDVMFNIKSVKDYRKSLVKCGGIEKHVQKSKKRNTDSKTPC